MTHTAEDRDKIREAAGWEKTTQFRKDPAGMHLTLKREN